MRIWVHNDVMPEWVIERACAAAELAVRIDRDGAGPGSLTDDGLHYSMTNGLTLEANFPTLTEWLHRIVPAYGSASVGQPLRISPDVPSAINVNVLTGRGSSYELHTDPCPYSALLFVTGEHDGGRWIAEPHDGIYAQVEPRQGRLVIFAGSIPHAVEPLRDDSTRISIPIALYPAEIMEVVRDPELDSHIGLAT